MGKCDIKTYLAELASMNPVPGGGSAAALVGALGVGLIEKVCSFTVGKERYKFVEPEMKIILKKTRIARQRLEELIELDQKAYLPVAKAYKLPKDTQEQQAIRKQKIETATKEAAKVPQEIAKLCGELLPYCDKLEKDGNQMLIGDTKCARAFLEAAIKGAEGVM